jgi:formylglycine-generating enzyme required for sulfatase activity
MQINFRNVFLFSLFILIFSPRLFSADDDLVFVKGGTFVMGSHLLERGRSNGEIQRRVSVNSFYMGKYQITQEEYEKVMGTNPGIFGGTNLPVENVTWFDALEYCNKRSQMEGLTPVYTIDILRIDLNNKNNTSRWFVTWNREANGYRLPTEAEWEYAAKGGDDSPVDFIFSGSNNQTDVAWYARNSGNSTHSVGTKASNSLGLHDMSGNVWEWCWDWYGDYVSGTQFDATGAYLGTHRVIRGGSWYDSAAYIRSAFRYFCIPSNKNIAVGFRIVRTAMNENWTEFLLVP